MKCFECGSMCITVYLDSDLEPIEKVVHGYVYAVAKLCPECKWQSHPVKIPYKF